MSQVLEMLKLQQELNDNTNGLNWEAGITKNGKLIDWRRCIYLEAAELVESYPWKHWKNIDASPDYDNIKIELVDIWHFVMSEALRLYKIENKGSIEELADKIKQMNAYTLLVEGCDQKHDYYTEIHLVEEMIKILFCSEEIDELMESFLNVTAKLGLNLQTLYALYIGKNILNKFRQDHGYKEGSYIKEWNGVEDNVIMQSILISDQEITADKLYQALKASYPQ
ncbi:MAG: dUTP diphosphatase [Campylobacterales bacterium]|nr:dUTP diphosphatase [Campylobacterales bacterium]